MARKPAGRRDDKQATLCRSKNLDPVPPEELDQRRLGIREVNFGFVVPRLPEPITEGRFGQSDRG
jgi:hypothetical protein